MARTFLTGMAIDSGHFGHLSDWGFKAAIVCRPHILLSHRGTGSPPRLGSMFVVGHPVDVQENKARLSANPGTQEEDLMTRGRPAGRPDEGLRCFLHPPLEDSHGIRCVCPTRPPWPRPQSANRSATPSPPYPHPSSPGTRGAGRP